MGCAVALLRLKNAANRQRNSGNLVIVREIFEN
jgi:hypothetical protein